jgi:F-type H+-transporting ATPase subunit b
MWVALSMTALILIMIWKKVPGLVTSGLDSSIAEIRKQLDEAKALRAEAEALRGEYAAKIANAEKDAAEMLAHARSEADAIVAKATDDTTALIARREKMAEDKIGAAERGAVAELRAKAAAAAATAARGLIAANHDAKADKALVDDAIAGL